jgi:hypothetical protein
MYVEIDSKSHHDAVREALERTISRGPESNNNVAFDFELQTINDNHLEQSLRGVER